MEPKAEYVEQLRTSMEKNFSKTMIEQMFHSDFKFHTKAIETLQKVTVTFICVINVCLY